MNMKQEDYIHIINKSIVTYLVGSLCFLIFAIASIYMGYYIIRYRDTCDLPIMFVFFAFAGIILLFEMLGAFHLKREIPYDYKSISCEDYPAFFKILDEITTNLRLSPIHNVYVSPDTNAAVFIQPQLRNLLFEPERNLVIGMGMLSQFDDDELRAVLYHEFGHYSQKGVKKTLHVYTISQFASSFLAVRKNKKEGTFTMQMRMQVIFFTYFSMWICKKINNAYRKLSVQMEYEADDVSVKYVGAQTLKRALEHAACINYNYNVIGWGMNILRSKGICVDNKYKALTLVWKYSKPSDFMFTTIVKQRLDRLSGKDNVQHIYSTDIVRNTIPKLFTACKNNLEVYSAEEFADWMHEGFKVYARQISFNKSVQLEIHMDSRKHKMPLFEGYYKLVLDDKIIGNGTFVEGYSKHRTISPGKHTLIAYAPSGIISTPFEFVVDAYKSYRIDMDYKFHSTDGLYDVFGEKITIL